MISKISLALMNRKEDLETLHSQPFHLPDWCPTHRYTGTLTMEEHSLVFHGRDAKERKSFAEIIPLNKITSISRGLDKCFTGDFNPLFSAQGAKPLRIGYQDNGGRQTVYIFTNLSRANHRVSNNQDWYEALKKYVSNEKDYGQGNIGCVW